ncbi:MAG: hypothetical protein M0Q53_05815 [Prolixibacteraceae bacterium]|jgi:hypothetical protein|nr:hypothetical protein [Prolixibacteraceae bacterium]
MKNVTAWQLKNPMHEQTDWTNGALGIKQTKFVRMAEFLYVHIKFAAHVVY